jgi:hypothetical protein
MLCSIIAREPKYIMALTNETSPLASTNEERALRFKAAGAVTLTPLQISVDSVAEWKHVQVDIRYQSPKIKVILASSTGKFTLPALKRFLLSPELSAKSSVSSFNLCRQDYSNSKVKMSGLDTPSPRLAPVLALSGPRCVLAAACNLLLPGSCGSLAL